MIRWWRLVSHVTRNINTTRGAWRVLRLETRSSTAIRPRSTPLARTVRTYRTCGVARYADTMAAQCSAETPPRSAAQLLLDKAHGLVSAVEQGENVEENAREAVHILETLLAGEQLSEDARASCYDGMGVCYIKMGDMEAAERVLNRGIQAHPTFAPLWLHLGEAQQQRGSHVHAIAALSKFIEQSKEFYHIVNTRYDVDAAAVEYQYTPRSQQVDPVQLLCSALFMRAVSYIRVREESMALADLWLIVDTAHSALSTARATLAIAQLARLRGDWHQARNLASKSIESAGQCAEQSRDRAQLLMQAHHLRAVCYEALDDESRAEQDHVLADFYFRESSFKSEQ